MPDYKTMYFELFNKLTDAIAILQEAQRKAEDAYIKSEEAPASPLYIFNNEDKSKT